MRQSVRDSFVAFSTRLEGSVPHFYADIKGLITTAIGNLVDPVSTALNLPLRHEDGSLASKEEILAEWNRVKSDPRCATQGYRYAANLCRLHLDAEGIAQVVGGRLDLNDAILTKRFPNFPEWGSDAQLAVHSHAWACGASFRFPKLERALQVLDWRTAAVECQMNTAGNPGLITRIRHEKTMFGNAAVVDRDGLNPEPLYWPRDLSTEPDAA